MCLGVDRYTEHAFFVFSKGIVGLRELFPSELVEWHIQRQEYTDAIHICQKEASLDLMIQTADKYGTYLWSKEQYEDVINNNCRRCMFGQSIFYRQPQKSTGFISFLN